MDGTIYSGGTLFETTRPFLQLLRDLGLGFTFVTNNSSKSSREYQESLRKLGIVVDPEQVLTSTQATVSYLREQLPSVKRLYVLGTASMRREMKAAGFRITAESACDEPDAVVVGFDTRLAYQRLCRAAFWIGRQKPFLATHPDRVCPTDQPTVLVDCGAVCQALQAATGRAPDRVLGKPDPVMIQGILQRHSLQPEELAMVGDRLYTDIVMARSAGVLGVLVLTGETTREQLADRPPAPDLVVSGLGELGEQLRVARGGGERSPALRTHEDND
jgi:NagD protein